MKVTATIQSKTTLTNGTRQYDPVDIVWCKDTDALGAVMAVSQILGDHANPYTEVLAIRIDV